MKTGNLTRGMLSCAALMLVMGTSALFAEEKAEKPKAAQPRAVQPKGVQKKIQIRGGQVRLFSAVGGRRMTAVNLINMKQVQEELKITDDQLTKLQQITKEFREEMRAAFQGTQGLEQKERQKQIAEKRGKATKETRTKILAAISEDQTKRLKQIEIQRQGAAALQNDEVATALKLSDEQKTQIKAAYEEQQKKTQEVLQQKFVQGQGRQRFAKLTEIRKTTESKVLGTLNDEQKKQFEEMKGETFEFRRIQLRPKAVRVPREA